VGQKRKNILIVAFFIALFAALMWVGQARANGPQQWIIIHHENQGNGQPTFTKCMPDDAWNGHDDHEGDYIVGPCNPEEPTPEPPDDCVTCMAIGCPDYCERPPVDKDPEEEPQERKLDPTYFLIHDCPDGKWGNRQIYMWNPENNDERGPNIYDPTNRTWQFTLPYDPLDPANPPKWQLRWRDTDNVILDPDGNPINWLQVHLEKADHGYDEQTAWGQTEAWVGQCQAVNVATQAPVMLPETGSQEIESITFTNFWHIFFENFWRLFSERMAD
jgi:hypothetical protein